MSLVIVYSYRFHNEEHGADIRAEPYATLELIKEKGWLPIMSQSLEVDSSEVIDGRYFPVHDANP
jgi:hypothetical protein